MNRRRFIKSGLLWLATPPAIIAATPQQVLLLSKPPAVPAVSGGGGTYTLKEDQWEAVAGTASWQYYGRWAAMFTSLAGDGNRKRVSARLSRAGTPSPLSLTCEVRTVATGFPDALVATSSTTITSLTTSPTQVDFDFADSFTLTALTTYYAVVRNTAATGSAVNDILWDFGSYDAALPMAAYSSSWEAGVNRHGTVRLYSYA